MPTLGAHMSWRDWKATVRTPPPDGFRVAQPMPPCSSVRARRFVRRALVRRLVVVGSGDWLRLGRLHLDLGLAFFALMRLALAVAAAAIDIGRGVRPRR